MVNLSHILFSSLHYQLRLFEVLTGMRLLPTSRWAPKLTGGKEILCVVPLSSCIDTTVLVGIWVIRTAEYVVFTDWPPGPDEQNVSIRSSFGSIFTSTSSMAASAPSVRATPSAVVPSGLASS